jgi:hypothetical protein
MVRAVSDAGVPDNGATRLTTPEGDTGESPDGTAGVEEVERNPRRGEVGIRRVRHENRGGAARSVAKRDGIESRFPSSRRQSQKAGPWNPASPGNVATLGRGVRMASYGFPQSIVNDNQPQRDDNPRS